MEREEPEFVTLEDGAARLGISKRTAWDLVRRARLMRYRLPGRGKTTFVRWADLERAYHTPRPIGPFEDESGEPKKLAA